MKIFYNCKWLFWAEGMVIYPFVFFKDNEDEVRECLFSHEMVHVQQVSDKGWIKFHVSYLWQLVTKGYKKNKYEIDARNKAGC